MKSLFFAARLALISAGLALISNLAFGQDVYNFYFQKADHPTEMVQVKNGEAVSAVKSPQASPDTPLKIDTNSPTAATASVAATQPAAAPKEDKKSFWRLGIESAKFTDHHKMVTEGFGVTGMYGINKYFGFEAQAIGGKGLTFNDYGDGANKNYFAGAAGIKITPIHVELFGWDFVDLAVDAGAMTTEGSDETESHNFRVAGYVGGEAALNFTDRLSLVFDGKLEDFNDRYGQATAGIAYRF